MVKPLLIRTEEEEFVLPDRAAHREAVHFQVRAAKYRFVVAGRTYKRRIAEGVEGGVAPMEIPRTVILVRARLHVQRDDAAGAVTVFGIHGILLKRNFLHGFN